MFFHLMALCILSVGEKSAAIIFDSILKFNEMIKLFCSFIRVLTSMHFCHHSEKSLDVFVKTDPLAKTPSRKEKLIRYKLVHRLHRFHRLKAVLMAWGQNDEKFGFCSNLRSSA